MTVQIGDTVPDFTAETTEGTISFHDWIGDSWVMMFSHPKDFTPVCTTELGTVARLKPEFDKRNVKIIGISIDSVDDHKAWAKDIEETQGHAPNYPMIGDSDLTCNLLTRIIRFRIKPIDDWGKGNPTDIDKIFFDRRFHGITTRRVTSRSRDTPRTFSCNPS